VWFSDKDQEQFWKQMVWYLGAIVGGIPVSTMLGFGVIVQ
jgi:hypothetical protein